MESDTANKPKIDYAADDGLKRMKLSESEENAGYEEFKPQKVEEPENDDLVAVILKKMQRHASSISRVARHTNFSVDCISIIYRAYQIPQCRFSFISKCLCFDDKNTQIQRR